MATILKAGNVATGAQITSDATGILEIKTGTGSGTTAITVGTDQAVTFAAGTTINGITVGRGAGAVATNTAVGASALAANTTGANNVAIGYQAAATNTVGGQITAVGYQAGYTSNAVGGTYLTAVGYKAAYASSSTGTICAVGYNALIANTTGADNTAVGSYNALGSNTTGANNTAVGREALQANTTASNNTAVGYQAGFSGTTATNNTLIGLQAGYGLTTGSRNTFVGAYNGSNGSGRQITTGSANTILGGYDGNQGGLDIRTVNNRVVLSDGDGYPNMYFDDISRRIENMGPTDGSTFRYKMRHWAVVSSNIDNPTIELCTLTGGNTNNSAMVKVRVFQLGFLGGAGSSGNEHIGLAWMWSNGSAHTGAVNTMTTTTTINNTNVGTLSWVSNGARNTTLRYTANRATNYDSYYIEIEITQNIGGGYIFNTPS